MPARARCVGWRTLTTFAFLWLALLSVTAHAQVTAVDSVGITVSDMDRAVDFYSRVLTFEKESDREVAGDGYERLFGLFGTRLRVVRMRLGDEHIELMQFLAPRGRPNPVDSRSNDRWFQ
ncbi:MAG: VOC family protein, partial [Steroidobacteraceae bacterium]